MQVQDQIQVTAVLARCKSRLNCCIFPCSIRVTFLLESGQSRVLGCLSLSSSPEYKSVWELHKSITWAGRCSSGRLALTRDSLTSTLCSCQTFSHIGGARILLIRSFDRFSYSSTFCSHDILSVIKQKRAWGHIRKMFTRSSANCRVEWVLFIDLSITFRCIYIQCNYMYNYYLDLHFK